MGAFDHGADTGVGVGGVADFPGGQPGFECLQQCFFDAGVHDEACAATAIFAHVPERGG